MRHTLNFSAVCALLLLPLFAGEYAIPPHPWGWRWLAWIVLLIAGLYSEYQFFRVRGRSK